MKREQLFRAAGVIAAASILSKILGYVREASFAAVFGANRLTDAYLVASVIPSVLFAVVSSALTMTLIPVFTKRLHDEGKEAGEAFVNSLLNLVILFCLVVAGLGVLLAPFIVRVIAPGFQGETFELTVFLTRVILPVVVFLGIQAVFAGILQANEIFLWPAIVGIPFNIVMISFVLLGGKHYGISVAAVGMVLAAFIQLLVVIPGLLQCRFRYHLLLNLKDPGMVQIGRLLLPILLATGAGQIGLVVDRMLASGLQEGSIAALNYGNLVTLSTSLSAAFTVILLLWFLRRRLGRLNGRKMLDGFWRISVASSVMGVAVIAIWMLLNGLASESLLLYAGCLAITISVGAAVYAIASALLQLPEMRIFLQFGRRLIMRLQPRILQENTSQR